MIFSNSRYSDGFLQKALNPKTRQYDLSVYRDFPTGISGFYTYVYRADDRLETLAYYRLGDSNRWTDIMDINPEISNPHQIKPGTKIRIPNV